MWVVEYFFLVTILGACFLRGIGILGRDVQEYEETPFRGHIAAAGEQKPFGGV